MTYVVTADPQEPAGVQDLTPFEITEMHRLYEEECRVAEDIAAKLDVTAAVVYYVLSKGL